MSRIKVVGLFSYPVKGMRGVLHEGVVSVTVRGLDLDRRFMLVDPKGQFITQRECPDLATHSAHVIRGGGRQYLKIQDTRWSWLTQMPGVSHWEKGERIAVRVWGDTVEAVVQSDEANEFLSRSLKRQVRLVYMPFTTERPSRRQRTDDEGVLNGFADGFPFLLTSEESLAVLNASIGNETIEMDRFRPNIVVRGCEAAFEEETWREFRIGNVTFYGMKRCGRCIVTTTDQRTGKRMGKEPLKTLAATRRFGNDVCFGMNLNHANTGLIQIGDEVEIIERGSPFIES